MGAFSSKAKASASPTVSTHVTAMDRTVLDLKNARDRLQRYREKLAKEDVRLREQAQKAKQQGQTTTALGLLRLRRFKQQQTEACEQQLLSVLQMVETIGSSQNDAVVLAAMAKGKDALKQLHEETTVEDVLELMDQIQEQDDYQREINEALQNVPELSLADEQAVADELAALEQHIMSTETPMDELPQAPTGKLPERITPAAMSADPVPVRVALPG